MGWAHERLEWAMLNMLSRDSEAVLVLSIDLDGEMRMSFEGLCEMPQLGAEDLLEGDGLVVGVAHDGQALAGDVWLELGGRLYASAAAVTSATGTLAIDLAQTLGIEVEVGLQPLPLVRQAACDGRAFLISDEFGLVPIGEAAGGPAGAAAGAGPGPAGAAGAAARIQAAFAKLW
jgi:hypothetical protein